MSQKFEAFLSEIQKLKQPHHTSPKIMLEHFGVGRRGWRVIEAVNNLLKKYELMTNPTFGSAYIYGNIEILPKPRLSSAKVDESEQPDPIPKLSLLKAANINNILPDDGEPKIGLISVKRDTSITEAITLMIQHNFSQLPILSGSTVEGLVSWRSIGRALALGKMCNKVMDCKEEVMTLKLSEPLFTAVKIILEKRSF